jgi:hypothetical protein
MPTITYSTQVSKSTVYFFSEDEIRELILQHVKKTYAEEPDQQTTDITIAFEEWDGGGMRGAEVHHLTCSLGNGF